jgi:16S rRNA (cytosine967-C5)-methyltransferase
MHYPREAALRVLTRVLSDRVPLDQVLESALESVSAESRSWLQEVTSGTLRWKGRLELAIDSAALSKRPSGWLRKALLLAAYQLCAQDRAPAGQVVSETVALVRKREGEAPARFANAVLRKISAHAREWRELPPPVSGADGEAAGWASLPAWLWKAIVADHGLAWATEFARAALDRPRIWVRARSAEWTPARDGHARKGPIGGAFEVSLGGPVRDWPGFASGDFFVQDLSSQVLVAEIAAEALARAGTPAEREKAPRALDLCAAPGGKALGLAWSGLRVTASDVDARRLGLLRESCARAAPGIRIVAPEEVAALEPHDLVWVDAPCSGTGILRRHPDVRWLRREEELVSLRETQRALIAKGWELVRPGGLFAYSVCSVLHAEGEGAWQTAQQALGLQGRVVRSWSLAPHLGVGPEAAPGGDGFWAVLVEKR